MDRIGGGTVNPAGRYRSVNITGTVAVPPSSRSVGARGGEFLYGPVEPSEIVVEELVLAFTRQPRGGYEGSIPGYEIRHLGVPVFTDWRGVQKSDVVKCVGVCSTTVSNGLGNASVAIHVRGSVPVANFGEAITAFHPVYWVRPSVVVGHDGVARNKNQMISHKDRNPVRAGLVCLVYQPGDDLEGMIRAKFAGDSEWDALAACLEYVDDHKDHTGVEALSKHLSTTYRLDMTDAAVRADFKWENWRAQTLLAFLEGRKIGMALEHAGRGTAVNVLLFI